MSLQWDDMKTVVTAEELAALAPDIERYIVASLRSNAFTNWDHEHLLEIAAHVLQTPECCARETCPVAERILADILNRHQHDLIRYCTQFDTNLIVSSTIIHFVRWQAFLFMKIELLKRRLRHAVPLQLESAILAAIQERE